LQEKLRIAKRDYKVTMESGEEKLPAHTHGSKNSQPRGSIDSSEVSKLKKGESHEFRAH
jgi:hypothetical protein